MLRHGDAPAAKAIAEVDAGVYGRLVLTLLEDKAPNRDAAIAEAIESVRPRLERFMPTLSTIITAAPMLGILGTVFGIISSFEALSRQQLATDPRQVGQGIAEALLTTGVGLSIAIFILFPYNAFRTQLDRTLGRMESLAAAAAPVGGGSQPSGSGAHNQESGETSRPPLE